MNSHIENQFFQIDGAPSHCKAAEPIVNTPSKFSSVKDTFQQHLNTATEHESASSLSGYTASAEGSSSSAENNTRSKTCALKQKEHTELYRGKKDKNSHNCKSKAKAITDPLNHSQNDSEKTISCKTSKKKVHFSDHAIQHVYSVGSIPEIDDVHITVSFTEYGYHGKSLSADKMNMKRTQLADSGSSCSSADFPLRRCASSTLSLELVKNANLEDLVPINKLSRSKSDTMIFQVRKDTLHQLHCNQDTWSEQSNNFFKRKSNQNDIHLPNSRTHCSLKLNSQIDRPPETCLWKRHEQQWASSSSRFDGSRERHPKTRSLTWAGTEFSAGTAHSLTNYQQHRNIESANSGNESKELKSINNSATVSSKQRCSSLEMLTHRSNLTSFLPINEDSTNQNVSFITSERESQAPYISEVLNNVKPCTSSTEHTLAAVPSMQTFSHENSNNGRRTKIDEHLSISKYEYSYYFDSVLNKSGKVKLHNKIKSSTIQQGYEYDAFDNKVKDAKQKSANSDKMDNIPEKQGSFPFNTTGNLKKNAKSDANSTVMIVCLKQCPQCGSISKQKSDENTGLFCQGHFTGKYSNSRDKYVPFLVYKFIRKFLYNLRSRRIRQQVDQRAKEKQETSLRLDNQFSRTHNHPNKVNNSLIESAEITPHQINDSSNDFGSTEHLKSKYKALPMKGKAAWRTAVESDSELLLVWEKEETSSTSSQDEMEHKVTDQNRLATNSIKSNVAPTLPTEKQAKQKDAETSMTPTPEYCKTWSDNANFYGCTLHPCESMIELYPLANDLLYEDVSEEEIINDLLKDDEPKHFAKSFDNFNKEEHTKE